MDSAPQLSGPAVEGSTLSGLRVLILSYYFPPLASAGGHRMGALSRHLAEAGADVRVVTVKHGLDVTDPALLDQLPDSIRVRRVPSLEGAKLRHMLRDRFKHSESQPDPVAEEAEEEQHRSILQRVLIALAWSLSAARLLQPWGFRRWIYARNAQRALREEIERERPDVLLASLGPMSQTWAALGAAEDTGVPVVFDFRDLWTTAPEYYTSLRAYRISRPMLWIDQRLERKALRGASFFVVNHDQMRKTLERLEPRAVGNSVTIPNGYEEDDFKAIPQPADRDSGQHIVRSVGTTYIYTVGPLLEACGRLDPETAAALRVELIGPYYDQNLLSANKIAQRVVDVRPPMPHADALAAMTEADVLLFLLRDMPGIEDMIPARLYEYLRLGKPLLALAPEGAAKELVLANGGTVIHPSDVDGLAAELKRIVAGEYPGGADPDSEAVQRFSRSSQALQLGAELRKVAERSR